VHGVAHKKRERKKGRKKERKKDRTTERKEESCVCITKRKKKEGRPFTYSYSIQSFDVTLASNE
jgi:hypothetical protein